MPSIFSEIAELNLWHIEEQTFLKQGDVVARVAQDVAAGPYAWWLVALDGEGKEALRHRISSDMNQRLATRVLSFTRNYVRADGEWESWCLRFESEELYAQFTRAITRALWESANELPWAKAKVRV